MCGIAGFIDSNAVYNTYDIASQMGKAIYSRGPDSAGIWQDSNYGISLVHRRLAILDLSSAGHQPMISVSGRYVIVFNGEVYNFKAVLASVESVIGNVILRGHSDTEVILLAIETFGFKVALEKFEGMFAIALWDREDKKLLLARDRVGEKPLYYGYFNGVFGFASELKALRCHPKFIGDIDRDALAQMMLHNCVPTPMSIYDGISKLAPGCFVELSFANFHKQLLPESTNYWSLAQHVGRYNDQLTLNEAIDSLDNLLTAKVADQMIADVPLGCFLSGGVDSSTIAALMQKQSSKPIKTFSIGFDNPDYNEAEFAKQVAMHLGTDHYELYISERDALSVVSKLPMIYDEPFSDSSQIPTFLVSQLAKQSVTVALSGDGGDELFSGYNRYLHASKLFNKTQKIPTFVRSLGVKLLPKLSGTFLSKLASVCKLPLTNISDKLYKLETLLNAEDFRSFYVGLTGHWMNSEQLVLGSSVPKSVWDRSCDISDDLVLLMQYLDCLGYLPDDILVKVDRAAMANSLETRVPLLNHQVIEFAFSLPEHYKINNGVSKYPLRQVLYKYVPRSLIERPKRGFAVPLNKWLRGELKDWAIDLLNVDKINQQGYLNSTMVNRKLTDHLNGTQDNGYYLWDVLMFQQWLEQTNIKI